MIRNITLVTLLDAWLSTVKEVFEVARNENETELMMQGAIILLKKICGDGEEANEA